MFNNLVVTPGHSESIGVRAIDADFVEAVVDRGLSIVADLALGYRNTLA